jgi:hypothetical protein
MDETGHLKEGEIHVAWIITVEFVLSTQVR